MKKSETGVQSDVKGGKTLNTRTQGGWRKTQRDLGQDKGGKAKFDLYLERITPYGMALGRCKNEGLEST